MNKGKAKRLRKELAQEQRAADVGYNHGRRHAVKILHPEQAPELIAQPKPLSPVQLAAHGLLPPPGVRTLEEQQHGPR